MHACKIRLVAEINIRFKGRITSFLKDLGYNIFADKTKEAPKARNREFLLCASNRPEDLSVLERLSRLNGF